MYKHKYHIMPPKGWLNDPNGSCYYKGLYHIFFQYSKDNVLGGLKSWGHYVSTNLVDFEFKGEAVFPDSSYDKDGTYSGTAYVTEEALELFYTGNVKYPGNYDYINEGRGHNVLFIQSKDGLEFTDKTCLLTNADYPSNMSCHVRDPKIFKEKDNYYMLLGARTRDSKAAFLLYESKDRKKWTLNKSYLSKGEFGYMWECPDYFKLNGQSVFSFCPQGLESSLDRFANVYQSGYIMKDASKLDLVAQTNEELEKEIKLEDFVEWDYGFDFYAPQTFKGEDNNIYLVAWAGVPDATYGNEPSIKEGWQHSMTLVRRLEVKNNKIYQIPVISIDKENFDKTFSELEVTKLENKESLIKTNLYANINIEFEDNTKDKSENNENIDFILKFNEDLYLKYLAKSSTFSMEYKNNTGDGRDLRRVKLDKLENLSVFIDGCIVEVYINSGEYVMTTRYYPGKEEITLKLINGENIILKNINAWKVR